MCSSFSVAAYELPMLLEMCGAWSAADLPGLSRLNDEFLATRESSELRAATVQMGYSLRALLGVLPGVAADLLEALRAIDEPSLPCVWSGAAIHWSIEPSDAAGAYLWSWAENQVLAAVKTLPMGQSAGQRDPAADRHPHRESAGRAARHRRARALELCAGPRDLERAPRDPIFSAVPVLT